MRRRLAGVREGPSPSAALFTFYEVRKRRNGENGRMGKFTPRGSGFARVAVAAATAKNGRAPSYVVIWDPREGISEFKFARSAAYANKLPRGAGVYYSFSRLQE